MKKPSTLLLALVLFSMYLSAQDVIIKKDGNELKAKVVEITDASIKYRNWDNLNGPIYNLPLTVVFMVKYENGQKDVFGNASQVSPVNTPASSNNTAPNESQPARFQAKSKGYIGTMEAGGSVLLFQGKAAGLFTFRTMFAGGRTSEHFGMGVRTGVDMGFGNGLEMLLVPVALAARISPVKGRFTPLIDIDAGYNLFYFPQTSIVGHGIMFSPSLGFKVWATKGAAFSIRAAYQGNLVIGNTGTGYFSTIPIVAGLEF